MSRQQVTVDADDLERLVRSYHGLVETLDEPECRCGWWVKEPRRMHAQHVDFMVAQALQGRIEL